MSFLPLLGSDTVVSKPDNVALMCSPAVLTMMVGIGFIAYEIVFGRTKFIMHNLLITAVVSFVIAGLCLFGMESVGWMLVLVPFVIIASLIVMIILTMEFTTHKPKKAEVKLDPPPKIPVNDEPSMKESYRYVMTGKGFMY